MRKYLIFIFLSVITLSAQTAFKFSTDIKTNKQMAIGKIDRMTFTDTAFASWFYTEYESYLVDTGSVKKTGSLRDSITIKIYMATWCSDSRTQIPRFYKILDKLNFDEKKLTVYCVDRKRQIEGIDISSFKIELVPTIIFFENGKEIGRIVETPKETLEKDLHLIVSYEIFD